MNRPLRWAAIIGTLAIVGGGAYYAWQAGRPKPAVEAPAVVQKSASPPAIVAPVEAIHHPVAPAATPVAPLPALDASDGTIGQALARALGERSLPGFIFQDRMILRFVATIDNLPRRQASARMMPVKPVGGAFIVAGTGSALSVAELRGRPRDA